ncbi:tetratricopeptide repeat protein [Zoogloea sp. LCSB751]|uniref:tetratricopeptide repeat protein n=1 Tax=Zoogloea sp. LCSB751 TaxID=1965277 RepID=UPI0009A51B98|nr:tetratricopeptide repeat protein [Zoogloea sp. LCSB751]
MKPLIRLVRPARLLAVLLIAGGQTATVEAQESAVEEPAGAVTTYPAQPLTPQILQQLMLAEIAGARGQLVVSARSYLDLARRTRDPRIARRAAEIAVVSRQAELASEASRLWLELDPRSLQAQQLASGAFANEARIEELSAQLARALAQQGQNIGAALMGLNRGLAQIPDKVLIRRLVNELTEPYLDRAEAHFARANAAFVAGDAVAASQALDGALAIRPDWEQAVVLKAQFEQEASPGAGVKILRDYLGVHPESREVRIVLARMLVASREYAGAREQFEIQLKREPDDRDVVHAAGLLAMQQGDRDAAEAHFRHLLTLGFGDPDTVRMYLGQIAEDARRYDDALNWYKAVAPGPQFIGAQVRVAQVLVGRGKLAEARLHLQTVARDASQDKVQYVLAEAQLLRDANRADEAFLVLDEALRRDPENIDLLYESALAAERLGRVEAMEGRLRKVIALKPDQAHAYNALGYSLVDRNQRLAEAEKLIRKALSLMPGDPFIIDSLGWALYRKGDLKGALEQLQKAFELRADPEIAAHLGEVLWVLGRREEATKTWREAAKANPDNTVLADVIKKFKP